MILKVLVIFIAVINPVYAFWEVPEKFTAAENPNIRHSYTHLGLECVTWESNRSTAGGISCNWDVYNSYPTKIKKGNRNGRKD